MTRPKMTKVRREKLNSAVTGFTDIVFTLLRFAGGHGAHAIHPTRGRGQARDITGKLLCDSDETASLAGMMIDFVDDVGMNDKAMSEFVDHAREMATKWRPQRLNRRNRCIAVVSGHRSSTRCDHEQHTKPKLKCSMPQSNGRRAGARPTGRVPPGAISISITFATAGPLDRQKIWKLDSRRSKGDLDLSHWRRWSPPGCGLAWHVARTMRARSGHRSASFPISKRSHMHDNHASRQEARACAVWPGVWATACVVRGSALTSPISTIWASSGCLMRSATGSSWASVSTRPWTTSRRTSPISGGSITRRGRLNVDVALARLRAVASGYTGTWTPW